MARLIDAEWLLSFFEPYPDDYQTPLGTLRACVDDAPSIDMVPFVLSGTIDEAVRYVKGKPLSHISEAHPMEGLVGRPEVELRDRLGKRVIVKVKARDFE